MSFFLVKAIIYIVIAIIERFIYKKNALTALSLLNRQMNIMINILKYTIFIAYVCVYRQHSNKSYLRWGNLVQWVKETRILWTFPTDLSAISCVRFSRNLYSTLYVRVYYIIHLNNLKFRITFQNIVVYKYVYSVLKLNCFFILSFNQAGKN